MKKPLPIVMLVVFSVILGGMFDRVINTVEAGGAEEDCSSMNGDVNADGNVDISEVTILLSLFRGDPAELPLLCPRPSSLSGLPETGQALCYSRVGTVIDCSSEDCPGQDGSYTAGCPAEDRFVDNGDGTVTDNCAGLMWQRDTGNDGILIPWCDALSYCEDLELADHHDWRLPNVTELQSIVEYGRFSDVHPVFGQLSLAYWASTSRARDPSWAWFVSFGGVVNFAEKFNVADVRAVRSVP